MIRFKCWNIRRCQASSRLDWIQLILKPNPLGVPKSAHKYEFPSFVAILMEKVWSARNKKIFENCPIDVDLILKEIIRLWKEHGLGKSVDSPKPIPSSDSIFFPIKWCGPIEGVFKANFDAAFSGGKMAIAVVVRDHASAIVWAKTLVGNSSSPLLLKLKQPECPVSGLIKSLGMLSLWKGML